MKDLAAAETRPLTDFEWNALASLEAGEDPVTAPSTNEIYMRGAVRAVKRCIQCHSARGAATCSAPSPTASSIPRL
jgi:hypothetical protein